MTLTRSIAASALVVLLAAGCSSSGSSGDKTSSGSGGAAGSTAPAATSVDAAARALLPAKIRSAGVITNAVNLPNPPMEFTKAGSSTFTGFDIDLADALGAKLGVRIKFDNVQFDQLLLGLKTGRDDMVLSALSDTAERQKVADWVDYFNSGDRFFTASASASKYPDYASLCGKTVVVASGTSFVQDVPALSKTVCAGKPAMKVLAVGISGNAGLELQLTTGRAVAAVTGAETFGYLTQTEPGKWSAIGDIFAKSPYGIAVRKDDTALRDAIAKALSGMIADGSYGKILARWSQKASALTAVTVNLTPSP